MSVYRARPKFALFSIWKFACPLHILPPYYSYFNLVFLFIFKDLTVLETALAKFPCDINSMTLPPTSHTQQANTSHMTSYPSSSNREARTATSNPTRGLGGGWEELTPDKLPQLRELGIIDRVQEVKLKRALTSALPH